MYSPPKKTMTQNVYVYRPGGAIPKDVQRVNIPDGVTVIEPKAFYDCRELCTVTIPNSVNIIGDSAFECCRCLKDIILPNSITEIGNSAFAGCKNILSVTIPDSVTKIGDGAFANASGLRHITISKNVTEIGGYTFSQCFALQSVTLPDSITTIGRQAFGDCGALQSIILPNGLLEIKMQAFYNSGLQAVIMPDSVAKIGGFAFCGCSDLQFVVMPDDATIDPDIFLYCGRLQSVLLHGVNVAPFADRDDKQINAFNVVRTLVENGVPLNEYTVEQGIQEACNVNLGRWIREYQRFGTMRLPLVAKIAGKKEKEDLYREFALRNGADYVPKILDELAATVHACGIPAERIVTSYDIGYTDMLVKEKIPIVPATACRCYFNKRICNTLIRKDKISVMAEAIALYNKSDYQEYYKGLMEYIVSHMHTAKTEDILYAIDHAEETLAKTESIRKRTGKKQAGGHRPSEGPALTGNAGRGGSYLSDAG